MATLNFIPEVISLLHLDINGNCVRQSISKGLQHITESYVHNSDYVLKQENWHRSTCVHVDLHTAVYEKSHAPHFLTVDLTINPTKKIFQDSLQYSSIPCTVLD